MANVLIKREVAARNVDAWNRNAKADVDIENGSIMVLSARSDEKDEDEMEVWTAEKPTAASTGVWMAAASEVVTTATGDLQFRNIVVDPRYFTNVANVVFSVFKPQIGDIVEMTLGASDKDYLVAGTDFVLETADAAGEGFALHKIDTSVLHIGTRDLVKSPITTYIYEVVKN